MAAENRVGRFHISMWQVEHYPDECAKVCNNMIVLKAEYHRELDAIEYRARSNTFDALSEGEPIPFYWLNIHDDGKPKVTRVPQLAGEGRDTALQGERFHSQLANIITEVRA